jgi:hypothetical protein
LPSGIAVSPGKRGMFEKGWFAQLTNKPYLLMVFFENINGHIA